MLVLRPLWFVILSRPWDLFGGFEYALLLSLTEDKGHLLNYNN